MTAAPTYHRIIDLSVDELRDRLREAIQLYVSAMGYPPGTTDARAPMWLSHMLRPGWRCVGALDPAGALMGIGYGYLGAGGQWWHEQVRQGLLETEGASAVRQWMSDYFELTELHVLPEAQGAGTGERLLRRLLSEARGSQVLLSTPEGPSRAWRLYRRIGFTDVLRRYYFAGDPRPFAVLGRGLPLQQPGPAPL
ncbi:MAG: GNAT family N-acetyltransferase [Sciscionella sp.]